MKKLLAVTVLCLLPLGAACAQTCSKHSPNHKVALLELYTSEGCSSCPPADRVVSALQKAVAADLVVPLGLHVDYWDDIGWKDRFSRPDFARRQRRLAGFGVSRTVYTPEMFIAGRELRDWTVDLPAAIESVNRQAPRADIRIAASAAVDGKLPVEIRIMAPAYASLYIALYEMGLSSQVTAGENHGTVLHHDYVVRDWLGPIELGTDARDIINVSRKLAMPSAAYPKNLGVAAFVEAGDGQVLQALALPLCAGR